ncbi:hypothetical protein PSHT_11035 [Puccinia striiformis]|uniref:Uncharacterized protein n=1 Tax=Puccinia striiformis TaxID=27350 RepID=A0A2S4V5V2_9BASI|nr:hypothetical protein PSHT_11035 [Puccinia striiformis]
MNDCLFGKFSFFRVSGHTNKNLGYLLSTRTRPNPRSIATPHNSECCILPLATSPEKNKMSLGKKINHPLYVRGPFDCFKQIFNSKPDSLPSSQFGFTNHHLAIAFLDPVAGIKRNVKVKVSCFGSKGTPTIYHNKELNMHLGESDLFTHTIANKTGVWGIGNVLSNTKSTNLAAVIRRCWWYCGAIMIMQKKSVHFDMPYQIPGNKNLGKAFGIFQIGREIIIAVHVTDYNKKAKVWMITALNAATASGDHIWTNEEINPSSGSSKPQPPEFVSHKILNLDSEDEVEVEPTTPTSSGKGKGKFANSSECPTIFGLASGSATLNRIKNIMEEGDIHVKHPGSFSTKRGVQQGTTNNHKKKK